MRISRLISRNLDLESRSVKSDRPRSACRCAFGGAHLGSSSATPDLTSSTTFQGYAQRPAPRRKCLSSGPATPYAGWLVEEAGEVEQPQNDAREIDAEQQTQDLQGHERVHGAVDVGHGDAGGRRSLHVEQRGAERRR